MLFFNVGQGLSGVRDKWGTRMEEQQPNEKAESLLGVTESADSHLEPRSEDAMDFSSWAAQPAPRRRASLNREKFDLDALKIFLILAAMTAGMALAVMSLF